MWRAARLTGVLFGIGAIREKAQRSLLQPRRNTIGCRPYLPITNDGPVKCRLLSPAAEVDPGSDATCRGLVLDSAADLGFVQALQDYFQGRRGQQ
jgi:hypothetical protein